MFGIKYQDVVVLLMVIVVAFAVGTGEANAQKKSEHGDNKKAKPTEPKKSIPSIGKQSKIPEFDFRTPEANNPGLSRQKSKEASEKGWIAITANGTDQDIYDIVMESLYEMQKAPNYDRRMKVGVIRGDVEESGDPNITIWSEGYEVYKYKNTTGAGFPKESFKNEVLTTFLED